MKFQTTHKEKERKKIKNLMKSRICRDEKETVASHYKKIVTLRQLGLDKTDWPNKNRPTRVIRLGRVGSVRLGRVHMAYSLGFHGLLGSVAGGGI
ncbi:hypothetical protein QL285_029329 [Trifolium repens]|nr:hypothetical protein QL285_029329 [Trifolium repens]